MSLLLAEWMPKEVLKLRLYSKTIDPSSVTTRGKEEEGTGYTGDVVSD
jgi:hypothetical protein